MNDNRRDFEQDINALLDGELDDESAAALKRTAEDDRDLAAAIVDAYQLQRAMEGLGVERAPGSLRKKLRAIPRREKPSWWQQPAWVAVAAAVPVVALSVALLQPSGPSGPSDAELRQAQLEAQYAFALIGQAGRRAGDQARGRLGQHIDGAVNDPIKESLPFVNNAMEETTS